MFTTENSKLLTVKTKINTYTYTYTNSKMCCIYNYIIQYTAAVIAIIIGVSVIHK